MTSTIHGILVGYDGSPDSEQALRWAAREARWRGSVLTVCHACAPGQARAASGDGRASGHMPPAGDQNLAGALRFAQELMGAGQARPLLAAGPAAHVLCEHSADADMVVVGARGRGGLPGMLLGSVGQQVCAHARGRVVVVRGHWHPAAGYVPGPVVVGADGSDGSRAAIAFAAEEAMLRAVPVLAVCALADSPGSLGGAGRMQEAFDRDIARREKEYPELAILRQVTFSQPRTALLEATSGAQLLVVGSRGRGGLEGMPLGSVSQAMLHHARCPVGVVHPQ
ncbi:MAG TPA: universal stress protein [Streptosporangiaceae bacterium]|nr:universal stress protein [Streptosporangiaceae bacterium]